jgi:hypothetical protein
MPIQPDPRHTKRPRKALLASAVLTILGAVAAQADPLVVDLWPNAAPGSEGMHEEEVWQERGQGFVDRSVARVHQPTLTAYLPLAEQKLARA